MERRYNTAFPWNIKNGTSDMMSALIGFNNRTLDDDLIVMEFSNGMTFPN